MDHELVDGVVLGEGNSALTIDTTNDATSTVPNPTASYWCVASIRATVMMNYQVLFLEIRKLGGREIEVTHKGNFTIFKRKGR